MFVDKNNMTDQNVITFSGNNEQLFTKRSLAGMINQKLTLIVPETHNAILIKDGQMLQTLSSGKYLVSKFIDPKTDLNADIQILFMSKTAKLKLLWGTAQMFLMYDSQLDDNYKVGMSGNFDVQIGDPRKCYLYLIGADENLTSDDLQSRLVLTVVSVLENEATEYAQENGIGFNQLTVKKREISARVLNKINQRLMSDYGITVFSFNIANIIIDEADFQRLSNLKRGEKVEKNLVCSACGNVLKPTAKFCDNCGKKVGANTICSQCGTQNADDSKFCINCGNKL